MTLACLAAGCSLAGGLITLYVMSQLVLTGRAVGLLSLLASIVMGADSIGPWVVNSTCSEGQVVGRRAVRAGPNV